MRTPNWFLAALLLGGCFDTHYNLTASGDTRRILITSAPPPENWNEPAFDDSGWQQSSADAQTVAAAADGTMPVVYVREHFDLGPDPESYQQLIMSLAPSGPFVAYVNGQAMTPPSTSNQVTQILLAPGAVQAQNNLLAIEIHPAAGATSVSVAATLDGRTGAKATGPQISKGPYLLAPTADGATIVWETDSAVASQAIVDGKPFDGGAQTQHVVKVTGLQPGSYKYHVEAGVTKSDEAQLNTAPASGKRLRFAVFGDNRTDGDVHRRLVELLQNEAPDFIVNTGDMVGESDSGEWQTFFNIEYPLLINTPLFPAMGNHEHDYGSDSFFAQLFPLGQQNNFQGRVYSSDFGDAHLAILDSNGDLNAQSKWLDNDLTAAEARGAKASFVVLHWGPVCGCSGISHGSNDEAIPVEQVAAKHGVAAIFSGHNHLYERGVDSGLNYVVTGGGGAPLNPTGTIAQTRVTQAINHYVIVDVLGSAVHLTAKDSTGQTFDDVQLTQ